MIDALQKHWPEYLMEAAGLGLFMLSAAAFATLLEHPSSPVRQAVPDAFVRRLLMGLAMGSTAIALIYSAIGARSGAHLNPATTLTFYRLGRVHAADAVGYAIAQFAGGIAGISLAALALGSRLQTPPINYVATMPGMWGVGAAFVAEAAITFVLMTVILHVSNHPRWSRGTGLCAGLLVAFYITVEAPISGMSMNPARSFASAAPSAQWHGFWIYVAAPLLGMLAAGQLFLRGRGDRSTGCAKLLHPHNQRCIHCGHEPGIS